MRVPGCLPGQQSGNMFIAFADGKDIEDQVTLQAQWL
jgi:hypothetical protein